MVQRRSKVGRRRYTRRRSYSRTRTPYRRQYRRRYVPSVRKHGVNFIQNNPFLLGQIDPFMDTVKGLKIPDQNTMQSETLTVQDEFSLVFPTPVGTENVRAFLFNTGPTSVFVESSAGTGSWVWGASFTGGSDMATFSNISNSYEALRLGANGVRISSPVAPTTATGFVHVCIYAPSTYGATTWPFPTSIGQMRDLPWYRKITLAALTQNPLTIVNKFLDQTAFRYTDPDETFSGFANSNKNSFQITHSWASILVVVEGVPTGQTVLTAETIHHFEALPKFGTSSSANPAAPSDPQQMEAGARISQVAPATHMESEQANVLNAAQGAVEGIVTGFLEGVGSRGREAANVAGQAAVSMGMMALANRARGVGPGIGGVNNDQYRLT